MSTTINNLCDKNGNQILVNDGNNIINGFDTTVQTLAAEYTGELKGTAAKSVRDATNSVISETYLKSITPYVSFIEADNGPAMLTLNIVGQNAAGTDIVNQTINKPLPVATSTSGGVVSVGNNITNTNGKISLSKANVLSALRVSSIGGWSTKTDTYELDPTLDPTLIFQTNTDFPSSANLLVLTITEPTSSDEKLVGITSVFVNSPIGWMHLATQKLNTNRITEYTWKYDSIDGWLFQVSCGYDNEETDTETYKYTMMYI